MPEPEMRMDPLAVGRTARRWDDQHLDLHTAAVRIGGASAGFTPAVAVAALEFAVTWQLRTEGLGLRSEQHADRLRAVLADWVETDRGAAAILVTLLGLLRELR